MPHENTQNGFGNHAHESNVSKWILFFRDTAIDSFESGLLFRVGISGHVQIGHLLNRRRHQRNISAGAHRPEATTAVIDTGQGRSAFDKYVLARLVPYTMVICKLRSIFYKNRKMERDPVLVGQCHCGKVRYETYTPSFGMTYCYCRACRSIHGAPFAPYTNVKRDNFRFTETQGLVNMRSTKVATRTICRLCHSSITMIYDTTPGEIGIVAGSIDERLSTAEIPEVQQHIFVGEKPEWHKILDNAEQFQGPSNDIRAYLDLR